MLSFRGIRRVVYGHRRLAAVIGVTLLLGVAALATHAALPEHHGHADGTVTVCIAASALCVAALGWGIARCVKTRVLPRPVSLLFPRSWGAASTPMFSARAGPSSPVILRL